MDYYKIKHEHLYREITKTTDECKICGLKRVKTYYQDQQGEYYKVNYINPKTEPETKSVEPLKTGE